MTNVKPLRENSRDSWLPVFVTGRAVFSPCGLYRYRLERDLAAAGLLIAYFGINGSTAGASIEDQTTRKWNGFTLRNHGRGYLVGNPFAYASRDVRALASVPDPIGPDNARHLADIIRDADLLVPCWGSRHKIPKPLWPHLHALREQLVASGKPIRIFGLTASADPLHPLMLAYSTPLIPWEAAA